MSLFARLFVPASAAEAVPPLIEALGLTAQRCSATPASGLGGSAALVAFDLIDSPAVHLEAALLELPDPEARINAYRALGTRLGRPVTWFHDDASIDAAFLAAPMTFPAETLLVTLAARGHPGPVLLELDVDGDLSPQRGRRLLGLPNIHRGLWQAVAFGDLEEPLALRVP